MIDRFFIVLLLLLFSAELFAQQEDSVKIYLFAPIEVKAEGTHLSQTFLPIEKDNLTNLLNTNGFNLIRKGTFFAQDIYGDGFKRNDIEVTIDGERYHSACPNRMDAPLTRINPLDVAKIEMTKNSSDLQSGLGGKINFVRRTPENPLRLKTSISAIGGYSQNADAAISLEGYGQRFNLRYAAGTPYENAEGKKFNELYNYKENYKYNLAELSFNGKQTDFSYGFGFSYTDNVSFPYLQMDERYNKVINGSFGYKNNKIYFNYTDHMMDNSLRKSPMLMRTDAKNFTVGIVGEYYEVYYRNWKAENLIVTPMAGLNNNLIPNTSQFSVSVNHKWNLAFLNFNAKAGMIYSKLIENDLSIFKQIEQNPRDNSIFPLVGFSVGVKEKINNNIGAGLLAETSTETPTLESQFISVRRPMGNPTWVGNTNLNTPIKGGLKGYLFWDPVFLEIYAVNVWNYVEPIKLLKNNLPFQSFHNINAYMLGFNFEVNYGIVNFSANYTFAKNRTSGNPLSEIAPLKLKTVLVSPKIYGFDIFIRHTFSDAQTRVDPILNETSTPQWNKIDMGLSYNWNYLTLSLEVENLTNELYYQHLSYLRNPFSSGASVYENGRIVRFNIMLNNLL
ncbi:MAG: hypothetical protein K8F60_12235 [Melioribacteraceae bacterium]|nr:hypothetical protein [Melioribacteraceae bacterium]